MQDGTNATDGACSVSGAQRQQALASLGKQASEGSLVATVLLAACCLNPAENETFEGLFVQGLNTGELAVKLGISVEDVGVRRAQLLRSLKRGLPVPEPA